MVKSKSYLPTYEITTMTKAIHVQVDGRAVTAAGKWLIFHHFYVLKYELNWYKTEYKFKIVKSNLPMINNIIRTNSKIIKKIWKTTASAES